MESVLKDNKELEFAVFCIESIAKYLDKDGKEIYIALAEKSNILKEYIIPEYEILHTQGKEYIVNDIVEVMRDEGVMV